MLNISCDASYVHAGIGASTPSVLPINISYSVGIVKGVNAKENYAKHFWILEQEQYMALTTAGGLTVQVRIVSR